MIKDSKKELEKISAYTRLLLYVSSLSENREVATKEINDLNAKIKQMALDVAEEEKKKSDGLLRHYEEVVGQLKQKHLQTIDGMLKNLTEKDKRISALTSQLHVLQTSSNLMESQLQSLKATLAVVKGEQKADYKKEYEELRQKMASLTAQTAEIQTKMEVLKEDNKRYRKEREEYKELNEKAQKKEEELTERLASLNFEIGKLKSRLEHGGRDHQRPDRQNCQHRSQEASEVSKQLALMTESLHKRNNEYSEIQRLHALIESLDAKVVLLEEENRKSYQQTTDLRLKYQGREYERELGEREPTIIEYLAGCRKRAAEFQQRLLNNSESMERFMSLLDRVYSQDLLRMAEVEEKNDNGVMTAQRIVDFYRTYLGQYSFDLAKMIAKKNSSKKQVKTPSTCCRCATMVRGESNSRCQDCKNTCHTNCIGFEFELLFGCTNVKQVSQLPSE